MTKPLLTVAIPTYNRIKNLSELINTLSKEESDFRILVADDCSPDNTIEELTKISKNIPKLSFYRNDINLGYSGNVCNLYDSVETDYVWFICDDDDITPGAVGKIIEKIKKHKFTVGVFNYTHRDPYGEMVTIGQKEDICYTGLDDLPDYQPLMRTTFLSTLVLKKIADTEEIRKTDYTNHIFVQMTLALSILNKEFKFCELSETVLNRKVGFKYGEFFKFHIIDHLKAVSSIETKFQIEKFVDWSIKNLLNSYLVYISQKIGLFIFTGEPTKETISYIKKFYGPFWSNFILFWPSLFKLTPAWLVKLGYFLILVKKHGMNKAKDVYDQNVDRAYKDSRKTKFTSYR